MTEEERLADLMQTANDIESVLAPWKGLTFSEAKAKAKGFTSSHEILQLKLWSLERQIVEAEELDKKRQ